MTDRCLQDQMYSWLADPLGRQILRRTRQRSTTLKELISLRGPTAKNAVGRTTEAMVQAGVLLGSKSGGFVLGATELHSALKISQELPTGEAAWESLRRPLARAIVLHLLTGLPQPHASIRALGPRQRLSESLAALRVAGLLDDDGTSHQLRHSGTLARMIGDVELAAYGTLLRAAEDAANSLKTLAYGTQDERAGIEKPQAAPVQPRAAIDERRSFEKNMLRTRLTYPVVLGVTPADDLDEGRPGRALLPRIGAGQSTQANAMHIIGDLYKLLPGAIADIFGGLLIPDPEYLDYVDGVLRRPSQGPEDTSPSKLRGLKRIEHLLSLRTAADLDPDALLLPEVRPRSATMGDEDGEDLALFAAHFDDVANRLDVSLDWEMYNPQGSLYLMQDETPTALGAWIDGTAGQTHVLRLVERVILHEHSIALRPGPLAGITPEGLTMAAHWSLVELQNLRRRVRQHVADHRPPSAMPG